jgi:hypothetical protein
MVAYVYDAQFPRSIATGGAHQQAKRLANTKPFNSRPTGHGGAHLLNNRKRNRCNCPMRCRILH